MYVMQSSVDVNQINSNFPVFFRPECNFGIVVIQSSMYLSRSIAIFKYSLDHNVIIIIVVMTSSVDVDQINSNFQVFFRPQCCYDYCMLCNPV